MAGKDFVRGILLAMLWWGLALVVLYAAARFAPEPWNMRGFILGMAAAWPLLAGLLAGWLDSRSRSGSGFSSALRWVAVPLLLLAALWWWLFPGLWQAGLFGKFALYTLAAALLSAGFSAGLAKARRALYMPSLKDADENDEDKDEDDENDSE